MLAGSETPAVRLRTERFYLGVPELFEAWVSRCTSVHTRRTYRAAVMRFVEFVGIRWPEEGWKLYSGATNRREGNRKKRIGETALALKC
jgi:hypothetical protein